MRPGAGGKCFNVATGESQSLNELVGMLNTLMGTDVTPDYGDPRAGDVKHSLADISHARDVLGYEPIVGFEEGLRATIEAFDRRGSLRRARPMRSACSAQRARARGAPRP